MEGRKLENIVLDTKKKDKDITVSEAFENIDKAISLFFGPTQKIKKLDGTDFNITEELESIREEICDNLCKYADTTDDDCICQYQREHGSCPLDRL